MERKNSYFELAKTKVEIKQCCFLQVGSSRPPEVHSDLETFLLEILVRQKTYTDALQIQCQNAKQLSDNLEIFQEEKPSKIKFLTRLKRKKRVKRQRSVALMQLGHQGSQRKKNSDCGFFKPSAKAVFHFQLRDMHLQVIISPNLI